MYVAIIVIYTSHLRLTAVFLDPSVKAAYDASVPVECSEQVFWTKYFKSKYFAQDKGVYVQHQNREVYKREDDIFHTAAAAAVSADQGGIKRDQQQSNGDASIHYKKPKITDQSSSKMDPAVDLTSTVEDYGSQTNLPIIPGGETRVEAAYNNFHPLIVEGPASVTGMGSVKSVLGMDNPANSAGNKDFNPLLPIINKYNRNSTLVMQSYEGGRVGVAAEEDPLLVQPTPEAYAELHLSAPSHPNTESTGNTGPMVGKDPAPGMTLVPVDAASVFPSAEKTNQYYVNDKALVRRRGTAGAGSTAGGALHQTNKEYITTLRESAGVSAAGSAGLMYATGAAVSGGRHPTASHVYSLEEVAEFDVTFKQVWCVSWCVYVAYYCACVVCRRCTRSTPGAPSCCGTSITTCTCCTPLSRSSPRASVPRTPRSPPRMGSCRRSRGSCRSWRPPWCRTNRSLAVQVSKISVCKCT